MTVYCNVEECRNNKDGKCENIFPSGEKAVKMMESFYGRFYCDDRDDMEEE